MPIHHFKWSYLVTATFGSLCLGDNCSSLRGTHTAEITLQHFLCRDGSTGGKAINRAIKPLANHISFFFSLFIPHLRLVPLSSASKNKQGKVLLSRGIVQVGWDCHQAPAPIPDPHSSSAWVCWTWLGYCKQNHWPFPLLRDNVHLELFPVFCSFPPPGLFSR